MSDDAPRIHFGDFLRGRIRARGKVVDVLASAKLTSQTAYRYFNASDPEPLRIEHYNKVAVANAAGFASWEEFDAAWRVTPVKPAERRSALPPHAAHLAATGQLKMLDRTPHAVIAAVQKLDHDGQVAVAKAIPRDVFEEAHPVPKAAELPHGLKVGKGVLLNYQVESLAAAPDLATFEQMVKEIRRQIKAKG
ncbi:MAG TPA: hypothetical protein VF595_10560 [Tepidisphaeraceae bacterium]